MDNDKALRKYIRIGFAFSCIFHSVMLLMGGFYLAVNEFFPSIAEKISIGVDYAPTDFPPFDIFILPFTFIFELILLGMYGFFPAIIGGAGLLRNIFDKFITLSNSDTDEAFIWVRKCNDFDFAMALLNFTVSYGFCEAGIYPKIFTAVNAVMLAVSIIILIKRPKPQKNEEAEPETAESETAEPETAEEE